MIDLKNIVLDKPIAFFDLETTGVEMSSRVVSIAITKIMPDGSIEKKYTLINPTIPIPAEATAVHKISDEDVKDKPKFSQLAKGIYDFMKDCYLCGYNSDNFDCPLLQEEFLRCGIDFPNESAITVDAFSLFRTFEKRDLTAALKFYCDEELTDAHNADADVDATVKVFFGQLKRYPELQGKTISELSAITKTDNRVDWQGKIIRDEKGEYIYNFGMNKGKRVKGNASYANWIYGSDFPQALKTLVKRILSE